MIRVVVLKIGALWSYCGGPLFIGNLLKQHLNGALVFSITFLPVGLMLVGAFFLDDDIRSRSSFALVWVGRLGLYIVLGMHLYAVWCFVHGVRVPDQFLHYLGIAVGVALSVVYLRAARRWASSAGGPSYPGDQTSPETIEPS